MPNPLNKRYLFTLDEIRRQNTALFELVTDDKKIIDVFIQGGLPSLAALYQDALNGQLEQNKQGHIAALVRDVYRLAGYDPNQYINDIDWAQQYLSSQSSKLLCSYLRELFCWLSQNKETPSEKYLNKLKEMMEFVILSFNRMDLSYWYRSADVIDMTHPLLREIFKWAHDKNITEQQCLHYLYALAELIDRESIADHQVPNLANKIKTGNFIDALSELLKLERLPSRDIFIRIAYICINAHLKQDHYMLAKNILDTLISYQKKYFYNFMNDVPRMSLVIYHPTYSQGREIKIYAGQQIIVETDVATNQVIFEFPFEFKQTIDFCDVVARYLSERYQLSQQSIAYLLSNIDQNFCSAAGISFKSHVEHNPGLENATLSTDNPTINIILNSNNQLRFLIGQLDVAIAITERKLLGKVSAVHEIAEHSLQGQDPFQVYLPGSFPTVDLSIVYEPVCQAGDLRDICQPYLVKRDTGFWWRAIDYLKEHPFKSLLWFTLAGILTAALFMLWPYVAGLLVGTGLTGIAGAITSFTSSLAAMIVTPLLVGLGTWWLMATWSKKELNLPNIVNDKVNQVADEKPVAKAPSTKPIRVNESVSKVMQGLNAAPQAPDDVQEEFDQSLSKTAKAVFHPFVKEEIDVKRDPCSPCPLPG